MATSHLPRPAITRLGFHRFDGAAITEVHVEEAIQLYNAHYGRWANNPTTLNPFPFPGKPATLWTRVTQTPTQAVTRNLSSPSAASYVRVHAHDRLVGAAFATRWRWEGKKVCWVTQLVVHREFREKGLGTGLLSLLGDEDDDVYGIISCHAAAIRATEKAFGARAGMVPLSFMQDHAEAIMEVSPVDFVREARLYGRVFDGDPFDPEGVISAAYTKHFINHGEAREALRRVTDHCGWEYGDLLPGHEFVVFFKSRRYRYK